MSCYNTSSIVQTLAPSTNKLSNPDKVMYRFSLHGNVPSYTKGSWWDYWPNGSPRFGTTWWPNWKNEDNFHDKNSGNVYTSCKWSFWSSGTNTSWIYWSFLEPFFAASTAAFSASMPATMSSTSVSSKSRRPSFFVMTAISMFLPPLSTTCHHSFEILLFMEKGLGQGYQGSCLLQQQFNISTHLNSWTVNKLLDWKWIWSCIMLDDFIP